jgi:hypothetical protein
VNDVSPAQKRSEGAERADAVDHVRSDEPEQVLLVQLTPAVAVGCSGELVEEGSLGRSVVSRRYFSDHLKNRLTDHFSPVMSLKNNYFFAI